MPRGKAVDVRLDVSKLRRMPRQVKRSVGSEIRLVGLDLLSEAVRRAPVDEGTLRGSGSLHHDGARVATGRDLDAEAETGSGESAPAAGGLGTTDTTAVVAFNAVYAEAQHERTDFDHPKGGEAKYLERPLEENRQRYVGRIAQAAKRELGGR